MITSVVISQGEDRLFQSCINVTRSSSHAQIFTNKASLSWYSREDENARKRLPSFTYKKKTSNKKDAILMAPFRVFIFFFILYEQIFWNDSDRRGMASLGWGFS